MDAQAYLRNQGWRGAGHSLDKSDRGITKPLLISKKVDVLGLGLNKHKAVSDQWWMRAFDQGLKDLGMGKESALAQVRKHGVQRGGLYAGFVRGEKLEGSIRTGSSALPTPEDSEREKVEGESDQVTKTRVKRKRKMDEDEASMNERPKEKEARRKQERAEKQGLRTKGKKVEKRPKAVEDGMYDEEANANRAAKYGLNLEKLEQYQLRASEKKLSLDEYIERRKQKKKKKKKQVADKANRKVRDAG